jgi:hypothetical protein
MALEDRNLPDKGKGRDLPERLINKNFDRNSEFEFYEASEQESVRKDSDWLARIAVLGFALHVYRGARGGNLFAEAMHFAGKGAQWAAKVSGRKQPLFPKDTGPLLREALGLAKDGGGQEALLRGSGARVGELNLLQDLAEAITIIKNPRTGSSIEESAELLRKHFKSLPRSDTVKRGVLDGGLEHVTVGDLLKSPKDFYKLTSSGFPTKGANGKAVPLEIGILEHSKKLKFITDETILDPHLLKKVTVGAEGTKVTKLLDTRMRNPFFFLDTIRKSIDPFGQISVLSSFFDTGRKVAKLGADKKSAIGPAGKLVTPAQELFIGGDVFAQTASGLKHVKRGQTLGLAGSARHLPALLRDKQIAGKLPELYGEDTVGFTGKNLFEKVQNFLGVGPKFHEQRGGIVQRSLGLIKQTRDVGAGEAKFVATELKIPGRGSAQALAAWKPELGGEIPTSTKVVKGKFAHLVTKKNRGVLTKEEVAALPRIDRLKAYAGLSSDLKIIKESSKNRARFTKEDLNVKFGRAGIPSTQRTLGTRGLSEDVVNINVMGGVDRTKRAQFFATNDARVDAAYDFANYMTIRLNKLASATLFGIGFRPSGNVVANTARLAAIPATYYAGYEALRYGNFAIGEVVGKSPVEAAADLYTGARVAQQKFRELPGTGAPAGALAGAIIGKRFGGAGQVIGALAGTVLGVSGPDASIASSANFIEQALLPGVDVGTIGTAASGVVGYGALQRLGSYGKALASAGTLYALLGGADVGQKAEQLERIYSGEEKVPIRKARFWMLGYQPFKGGQISHYAPSWYTKLKQDPAAVNIYGSEKGYWKHGSLLPTPHNLFGLRTIADPYKLERANYYNRPYPVTAGLFEQTPVIGPLLSDTIGSMIKPRKQMHMEEQAHLVASSNIHSREVPENVASQLGIPDIPKSLVDIDRPDILEDRLKKYANVALEPTGIWKFTLELFGLKMDAGYKLASADNLNSISRSFYEASLGGALGETEFIRRFIMSDYGLPSKINAQVNPITNSMPRWLPGSLSELETDRDYFYDFTKGDPYTKIPGGEYRLPGAGYEAVNKLHSGTPGQYDSVDKLLVLGDVAPFSAAYHKAASEVSGMNLTPYWQKKVEQSERYRSDKIEMFDFYEPEKDASEYYSGLVEANQTANLPEGPTSVIRNAWSTIAQEGLAEIPVVGSKIFPFRDPADHYKKFQVYGDTFSDWHRPVETIVRPAFYDVAGEDPFTGAMKGAMLGALAGGVGPLGAFKFLNPVQGMVQNEIASIAVGSALGAGVSTARMMGTRRFEGGYIPPHVQTEREVGEYFDMIKYQKYRTLQEQAEESNNTYLAKRFSAEARRTNVFGLAQYESSGELEDYARTLDRSDRSYFEAFLRVPTSSQGEVLGLVPDHMRQVLSSVYDGNIASSNKSVMAYMAADEQTASYFRDHSLPDENWIGWHPTVPDAAIRIKSIQGGINGVSDNVHRFGFYPNQERESDLRFSSISSQDMPLSIHKGTGAGVRHWMKNMFYGQAGNTFSDVGYTRAESSYGQPVNRFNVELKDTRGDQLMSFLQDTYR